MNELVISASMEIGVMLEAVTSDIAEHFYSLHGPSPQCARPPKTPRCSRRQMRKFSARGWFAMRHPAPRWARCCPGWSAVRAHRARVARPPRRELDRGADPVEIDERAVERDLAIVR